MDLANSTACRLLPLPAAAAPPRRRSSSPAVGSVTGLPAELSAPTASAVPSAPTTASPSSVPAVRRAIAAPERSQHRMAVLAHSPQRNSETIADMRRCDLPHSTRHRDAVDAPSCPAGCAPQQVAACLAGAARRSCLAWARNRERASTARRSGRRQRGRRKDLLIL